MSCRYFGISRQAYYTWYCRYQAEGIEGLRTRSKAPKSCPNATHVEVVGKIIYLRQNYHLGPEKIAMYFKRYHDVTISNSGVWRILNRLDMGRLPASQRYKRHDRRWKRYEKQLPGHRVQIDVKFIEPLASMPQGRRSGRNKYFQFTAIDDCTRLRVLRIYPTLTQATAIQFLDYVVQHLPFQVEVIQTDNGAEFQSVFHWHVLDKGIAHTHIKPGTPRLNGKVERSHRIDAEEFCRLLDGVIGDDAEVFNDKLREWEDYYNYHRPHGGLGGQTPYERLPIRSPRPRRSRRSSVAHRGSDRRGRAALARNCDPGLGRADLTAFIDTGKESAVIELAEREEASPQGVAPLGELVILSPSRPRVEFEGFPGTGTVGCRAADAHGQPSELLEEPLRSVVHDDADRFGNGPPAGRVDLPARRPSRSLQDLKHVRRPLAHDKLGPPA